MNKDSLKDYWALILALVIIALSCLYAWGYKNGVDSVEVKTIETIKYIKGEEVHDTIYRPEPYAEFLHDTVTREVFKEVDTARLYEIWCDYYKTRSYALDFSNDTTGVFKVDLDVTENMLATARSTVQPITRIETREKVIYKTHTIRGYGLIGTSIDFQTNQVQLGVELFDRYMVGASGIRNNDKVFYTINAGIKF